jgi:hypothetical protein
MNQGFENQAAQILQPSATDSPRLALAKSTAKLIARQYEAEAAAPAIEHARNLSLGISGSSHAQKSQPQPSVLGATRR